MKGALRSQFFCWNRSINNFLAPSKQINTTKIRNNVVLRKNDFHNEIGWTKSSRPSSSSICSSFSNTSSTPTSASSLSSSLPEIKIVEVGPRDGLQNESLVVSVDDKVSFISQLVEAGCRHIETGSFVSPKHVLTMANTDQVMERLCSLPKSNVIYSCLVPNLPGLERAIQVKECLGEIAIFASASEQFSQRNIRCSIEESLQRFQLVAQVAREQLPHCQIRAYLSCVVACPYEGPIPPQQVARVAERLFAILPECHEISLGDTIGVATPAQTLAVINSVAAALGGRRDKIAVHFHDTYGQALANIYAAIQQAHITTIDAATAGLGGCPFAGKGASGNVATEDVVYLLQGLGISTGLDLDKLVQAGNFISNVLGKKSPQSKVAQAILASKQKS